MRLRALEVLELPRVLELVAERAASPLGRQAVLARLPSADPEDVRRELRRVEETAGFLAEKPSWGPPPVPDARAPLQHLAVEGSVLEPPGLHALGVLLASSRKLSEELDGRGGRWAALASLRKLLFADRALEAEVERTVDAEGNVLDGASPELARIRRGLVLAHSRIVRKLEAFARSLPERYRVPDASVTLRGGRYVIAIRREGKGEVGGIVLDESATGATVFVEPPLALQLMNELGELERREMREVRRILAELTRTLRPFRDSLAGAQDALVDFDSLHARARMALEWRAEPPDVLPPGSHDLVVRGGRHPLLLARAEAVVPFDLDLGPEERVVVVSGPNTGGKSVFLKAMGLLALLAQCGVLPPVRSGTRLPVFRAFYADIGDEQSIEGSLSTFAAHLAHLLEIVREADGASLVLVDEMGTGTDPAEGAALARAVLETLAERGALTVATSHLGALKHLDRPGSGIVNASLQFDPDRMEPTYQLVKGRPGRSYGLAIARRLGFPGELLDRAEGFVSSGEAAVQDLLEKLERREKQAAGLARRLDDERDAVARLRVELEGREREMVSREAELLALERTAERRAREAARDFLMRARREVEEAIREVKAAEATSTEEASRRARRRVEEAARRQRTDAAPRAATGRRSRPLEVGQRVSVGRAGPKGRLVEVRQSRAVVEASGLRLELPLAELFPVEGSAGEGGERSRTQSQGAPVWAGAGPEPSPEVDLRGLRVEEVDLELSRALDAALLGDLRELRIIHGKGTGALRGRVAELLRGDPRVREFRLGLPGEGGAGVTVARLGAA